MLRALEGSFLLELLSGESSHSLLEWRLSILQDVFSLDRLSDDVLSGGFEDVGMFLRHSTLNNVDKLGGTQFRFSSSSQQVALEKAVQTLAFSES